MTNHRSSLLALLSLARRDIISLPIELILSIHKIYSCDPYGLQLIPTICERIESHKVDGKQLTQLARHLSGIYKMHIMKIVPSLVNLLSHPKIRVAYLANLFISEVLSRFESLRKYTYIDKITKEIATNDELVSQLSRAIAVLFATNDTSKKSEEILTRCNKNAMAFYLIPKSLSLITRSIKRRMNDEYVTKLMKLLRVITKVFPRIRDLSVIYAPTYGIIVSIFEFLHEGLAKLDRIEVDNSLMVMVDYMYLRYKDDTKSILSLFLLISKNGLLKTKHLYALVCRNGILERSKLGLYDRDTVIDIICNTIARRGIKMLIDAGILDTISRRDTTDSIFNMITTELMEYDMNIIITSETLLSCLVERSFHSHDAKMIFCEAKMIFYSIPERNTIEIARALAKTPRIVELLCIKMKAEYQGALADAVRIGGNILYPNSKRENEELHFTFDILIRLLSSVDDESTKRRFRNDIMEHIDMIIEYLEKESLPDLREKVIRLQVMYST